MYSFDNNNSSSYYFVVRLSAPRSTDLLTGQKLTLSPYFISIPILNFIPSSYQFTLHLGGNPCLLRALNTAFKQ